MIGYVRFGYELPVLGQLSWMVITFPEYWFQLNPQMSDRLVISDKLKTSAGTKLRSYCATISAHNVTLRLYLVLAV